MPERDFTNDYEDWRIQNPFEYQGKPEPPNPWVPSAPTPTVAPVAAPAGPAPTGGGQTGPPDGSTTPNMDPPGVVGGYWMGGQWVPGEPRSAGGGGSGGGGPNPFVMSGARPSSFPGYQSAGPFMFDPFSPSSWEDAENEPGYKASQARLQKQIEAGAAYQGMLRSGMTFDKLGDVLTNFGQQNFSNFDNRRFRNWAGNRDLAESQFGFHAADVDRGNNFRFNVAKADLDTETQRWLAQVQSLTQLAQPPG